MKKLISHMAASVALLVLSVASIAAAERRTLHTGVPDSARSQRLGPLPAAKRLQLAIGLPLRNRGTLTNLLTQLYNPGSANFHRYLTPAKFTEQFGPQEEDYQNVMSYAKSNHLDVVCTYNNRALVDVAGRVADIETMFHVKLGLYNHPTENRQFFAPDVEPSIDTALPISYVIGLDNYITPQPRLRRMDRASQKEQANIDNGSGTNGYYIGSDFRNAYAPGLSSLKGQGQIVGLFEFVGYTSNDITRYESLAGLPAVPLQNVVMPGASGLPDTSENHNEEVALDIEMVISMAPRLSKVLVVEAYTGVDAMNQLAYPSNGVPLANQISSSWGFSEGTNVESQVMEMAAQGQSFFLASGDTGAPTNGIQSSTADDTYVTMVGGSELSMNGAGTSWSNEVVWNHQFANGSSTGYIETDLGIPIYQGQVNTTANGGSRAYRNVPDVAMCADFIEIVYTHTFTNGNPEQTGQIVGVGGTSAAAPLWAAFTSLVNQQAANQGQPAVGFLNPALYNIAAGPSYTSCFHDITVGNDTNTYSANLFKAGPGYDNCTGLGSPAGDNMINALLSYGGVVFVEFGYNGSIQNGSYFEPFKTLAAGVSGVNTGGTIIIKGGGSTSETMTITKPLSVTAIGGAATVGN